ncbi:hypothetical protein QO179_24100 [Bacillus stercoris]|nr:hypothetical protein [Bacillus stercoris]
MSSVVDLPENEWVVKKQQYKERLSSIMIPLDPTPGIAKGLLSRIDNLFSELRLEVAEGEGKKKLLTVLLENGKDQKQQDLMIQNGNEMQQRLCRIIQ